MRNRSKQRQVSENMRLLFLLSACGILVSQEQSTEVQCILKPYGVRMCEELCSRVSRCSNPLYVMRELSCSMSCIRGRTKQERERSRKILSKTKEEVLIKKKQTCGCRKFRAGKDRICIKFHSERKSWTEAQNVCESCKGRLIKADTKAKMTAMKKLVGWQRLAFTSSFYWTGAKDLHEDNRFYWTDSSPMGNNSWGPAEPTHAYVNDNGVRLQEDCVAVLYHLPKGFYFYDKICTERYSFIYESQSSSKP